MEKIIIEANKVGSKLIFKKGDNTLAYDFKDKKFIKNDKRELIHPQTFFRGYNLSEILKDDSEKAFSFIDKIARIEDKCSNIGTFLTKLKKYQEYEAWFYLGIRAGFNIKFIPSDINKKAISFVKKHKIIMNNDFIEKIAKEENFVKIINFLESNNFETKDFAIEIVYQYNYDNLVSLIKIGYNYKALILYIDKVCRYEALDIGESIILLRDYAIMQTKIRNGKYEKYPMYLKTLHDIILRNYTLFKQQYNEELFKEKINLSLEYSYLGYKVVVPKCTQDVKEEGMTLAHCVGSYIDKIINGESYIVFLRKDIEESLVTIEIKNNTITQAKGLHNRPIVKEEMDMLVLYAKNKGLKIGGRL